ncbi:hypothetical protein TRICHSKD4_5466 [Roseibium sp. TrichSKD4]|nr:hypothetical protein TRICHSKD4_5466 [Roseibium sp. TrichSKD4]
MAKKNPPKWRVFRIQFFQDISTSCKIGRLLPAPLQSGPYPLLLRPLPLPAQETP